MIELTAKEKYQLEDDVIIQPYTSEQLPDGYIVFRKHGRGSPVYISSESVPFVEKFKTGTKISSAISSYAQDSGVASSSIIEETYLLIRHLRSRQLLRRTEEKESHFEWVPKVGDHLSNWVITKAIRTMDESAAFHCQSETSDKDGFLKFFNPDSEYGRVLFENEVEILQSITGQHVPALISIYDSPKASYFVMAKAPGHSLSAMRPNQWPLHTRINIAKKVILAYVSLHQQGILHADIHPGNIMVSNEKITIVDFGVARSKLFKSKIQGRPVIPNYYEPEVALALCRNTPPGPPTQKGEQYCIAALVFHILTAGDYLNFSVDRQTIYKQIAHTRSRSLSYYSVDAPALEAVLQRALNKDPAQRYKDTSGFYRAFKRAADKGARLDKVDLVERMVKSPPKNLTQAPTASVNFGAAGVAFACLLLSRGRKQQEYLPLADQWLELAEREIQTRNKDAFFDAAQGFDGSNVSASSPLHQRVGVDLVDIMRRKLWGDAEYAKRLQRKIKLPDPVHCNPDLFIGDFGLLLAIIELDAISQKQEAWINAISANGLEIALARYKGDNTGDYGLAHGMGGVLYVLSRYMVKGGCVDQKKFDMLKSRYLSGYRDYDESPRWPWGKNTNGKHFYMPGLCSGDAGHSFILMELAQTDGSSAIEQALQACLSRMSSPALWKVGHICCGAAGGALALAHAGEKLNDVKWSKAALDLGDCAIELDFADSSHSLMKGALGAYLIKNLLSSRARTGL